MPWAWALSISCLSLTSGLLSSRFASCCKGPGRWSIREVLDRRSCFSSESRSVSSAHLSIILSAFSRIKESVSPCGEARSPRIYSGQHYHPVSTLVSTTEILPGERPGDQTRRAEFSSHKPEGKGVFRLHILIGRVSFRSERGCDWQ